VLFTALGITFHTKYSEAAPCIQVLFTALPLSKILGGGVADERELGRDGLALILFFARSLLRISVRPRGWTAQ
jgi:hypothetical protein